MLARTLRVIFGFILACLAAGLTIVLFVYTPTELVSDMAGDRLSEAGMLSLAAATHTAVFAAPFALIGAAIGEWQNISNWAYYALVGIVIAALGFFVQFWSEGTGDASILNIYALIAFLVTGLVAGLIYWLFAGRYAAGWPYDGLDDEYIEPTRPPTGAPSASRVAFSRA